MEVDFKNSPIDFKTFPPREIEEVFEDPFSLRLLPDVDREDGETRYYLLGKTISNRALFLSFRTNGKEIRPIAVREMSEDEVAYYDRVAADFR